MPGITRSLRLLGVVVAAMLAFGPTGYTADTDSGVGAVTFTKDVAPILQAKCQSCHEPDSIAPMALRTYDEVRPWARGIRARVAARQMPPWHIDRGVGVQKFKNDLSLTDKEIATIVAWVDQGAPRGNPADFKPKPVTQGLYWQAERDGFGPPDIVIKAPMQTMPGVGQDEWWRPISDIPVTEPRWVRMVEIRPVNQGDAKSFIIRSRITS
jgi:hypothetical protein